MSAPLVPIYLDNATAAKPSEKTYGRMLSSLCDDWVPSSSPSPWGQSQIPILQRAVNAILSYLHAPDQSTLLLTSSGVEAVNQVIHSVYQSARLRHSSPHFLTAASDEAAAVLAVGRLEKSGAKGTMIPIDSQGQISVDALIDSLTPQSVLFSTSLVNGLTGVIQNVKPLIELCKERGVLVHLEISHALPVLPIDLTELGADYITFDASPIHGPLGVGGLYSAPGMSVEPLIAGGGNQKGMRGGVISSSLVLGLEQAFMELQEGRDLLAVEGTRLRNRFETLLTADQKEILSPFSQANRVPHISCLLFPEVSSEALLFLLNETRVYATRGGGNFQNLFRLLTAHAICAERAHCGLSFALSRHTKESEIERAAEEMMRCYRSLRRVSQQCFSTPQQASSR